MLQPQPSKLTRSAFECRTAPAGFLPVDLPAWVRPETPVGEQFHWEQRYWIAELLLDGKRVRGKEKESMLRERLALQWGLGADDIIRPTDVPKQSPQTPLFSTRAILLWLLHKRFGWASNAEHRHRQGEPVALFRRAFHLASLASTTLGEDSLPTVHAACLAGGESVALPLQPGGLINIADFVDVFPEIENEWVAIQARVPQVGLQAFDADHMRLADWVLFLDLRCQFAGSKHGDDWFSDMRTALITACACLIEVHMVFTMAEDQRTERLRIPHVLLGPKKMRRVRHGVLTKLDLQKRLAEVDGSANVISNTLGLTHGMSRVVQSVQNEHYTAGAQELMAPVHGITVNWDQSTHGGYDMNVGFVTDIDSSNGAYMRPAAPPYTKKVVVSRVGVG